MAQFQLGSVSTGTLRTEDLLETFAATLNSLDKANPLIGEALDLLALDDWNPGALVEKACEIVNELTDALNECSPPFVYFGAHEGDGADFGFWIAFEALDEERQYGDATENPEETYLPESNVLVHVNDHGNVTCLDMERNVLWSCV
jgi:hypothetical protein